MNHKIIIFFTMLFLFSISNGQNSNDMNKLKLDSVFIQKWDANTSQWVKSNKNVYIYDNEDVTTHYIYDYDYDNKIEFKYDFNYSENGELSKSLFYTKNSDNIDWGINKNSTNFTYDTNGNLLFSEEYILYFNEMRLYKKVEYTYDSISHLTQKVINYWDFYENLLDGIEKFNIVYDEDGNKTQEDLIKWVKESNSWYQKLKYEYSYDEKGYLSQKIEFVCFGNSDQWDNASKYEYIYDTNGYLSQTITSHVTNLLTQEFKEYSKKVQSYDINGNPTQIINYLYDEDTQDYIFSNKQEFIYDLTSNKSDIIYPTENTGLNALYSDMSKTNPTLNYVLYWWDYYKNNWIESSKGVYYYSRQTPTGLNEANTEIFKAFPNPFSGYINLSIPNSLNNVTFELFDMQGHKIFNEQVNNDRRINVENLPCGTYFYNVIFDGKKQSGKLLKK